MEDDKYQPSDDEDLHEGSGEDHIQTPENSTTSSSGNCSLSYGWHPLSFLSECQHS